MVLAHENKDKSDQAIDRRTLSSVGRVHQMELICEYNDRELNLKSS